MYYRSLLPSVTKFFIESLVEHLRTLDSNCMKKGVKIYLDDTIEFNNIIFDYSDIIFSDYFIIKEYNIQCSKTVYNQLKHKFNANVIDNVKNDFLILRE